MHEKFLNVFAQVKTDDAVKKAMELIKERNTDALLTKKK